MRPMLPSWMTSRNCRPRFAYFFPIDTTRRRLASINVALAFSATRSPLRISRTVSRSTLSVRLASSSTFLIFLRALAMTSAIASISSARRPSFFETARCRSGDERISRTVFRNSFNDSPDLVLAGGDLSPGLLDARDEFLQPADDPIDRLLVEPHLQERLQDRRLLLAGPRVRFPQPPDLLDRLADAVDVPLLVELGVLLVDVPDDLLDADLLLAQLVGEAEDLLDRDRRVQHDLQHAPIAVLDALGDLDLALAREQRDGPHLAHVHAHRIAGPGASRRRPLPPWPRPSPRPRPPPPPRRRRRARPCPSPAPR